MPSSGAQENPNQSPPFEEINLFSSDAALRDAVEREGADAAVPRLTEAGASLGSREAFEFGRLANEFPPRLQTHDPKGGRLDIVEFHPAYHALMERSMALGLHCSVWEHLANAKTRPAGNRSGANVARAAAFYMTAQTEAGHCCPITMTSAAVPTLLHQPDLGRQWLPKIFSHHYDRGFLPAHEKASVTIGMGMTERQGGSDVRANITRAEPLGERGGGHSYAITGHKWFMSAPMCDAFLVLAQAPGGLSCFLLPRFRPDGSVNALHLVRLKDKLGNRSNASSEAEFDHATGFLLGEEGRGVPAIIEMVTHTRLDCALASAALMRIALATAVHHCRHRRAFGRLLIDQPMMALVLADLALELEAAVALTFRLAAAFDSTDQRAAAWRRLMTPVTKYWVCKIAPAVVGEALECLGGNGYVEESLLPRLYREAPLNSLWEGAGNIMALDVLRVLERDRAAVGLVLGDLAEAASGDPRLESALARVEGYLAEPRYVQSRARAFVEGLALVAAGTLLRKHSPPAMADAFIATRLAGPPRQTYGQGLEVFEVPTMLGRVLPS